MQKSLQPLIRRLHLVLWTISILLVNPPLLSREYLENKNSAVVPQPQEWQEWHSKFNRFVQLPERGKISLVFIGDSIMEGWNDAGKEVWEKYYSRRKAANFGISGDRTQHLLWRIEHGNLDGLSPDVVVLLIGTNNIKEQRNSVQETTEGILAVTKAITEKLPNSRILVLGIFPCGEYPDCQSRQNARAVNQRLRKAIKHHQIDYLELDHIFVEPSGRISSEIMPDYLHLTSLGYQLWANAMEPYIRTNSQESGGQDANRSIDAQDLEYECQYHE